MNTQEGSRLDYVANGPDRCFHSKDELFIRISDEMLASHRLDAVAYGENADDAKGPDRPGARAATIHHVLRPLVVLILTSPPYAGWRGFGSFPALTRRQRRASRHGFLTTSP